MTKKNKPERATMSSAPLNPSPSIGDNGLARAAQANADTATASNAAADQTPLPTLRGGGIGADEASGNQEPDNQGPVRSSTRIPFGSSQQRLTYPPRPGFYRYWFRDDPGRIMRAKAAGYEHVIDEITGQAISRNGGATDTGKGLDMFLMEQPMHFHEEDVALGQKPVDEIDRAIRDGALGREKDGAQANTRYQPEGRGIKIGVGNRAR